MTIEHSHGKARPTLPRSSDLLDIVDLPKPLDADAKPPQERNVGGHFAAGNRIGVGARWKNSVKKLLGQRAGDSDVALVARDAHRIFLATLRVLPSDVAPVRSLVALHARHVALAAYYGTKAADAGLATPEGIQLDEVACKHSRRAERVMVTALDVSTCLAAARRDAIDPHEALRRALEDES